jgi:taurine-pyruvate aminotransferase
VVRKDTEKGARQRREPVEKDNRNVWHAPPATRRARGGSAPSPRMIVAGGEGPWISDTGGNRYLDRMSGLWCVNVGYDGREE